MDQQTLVQVSNLIASKFIRRVSPAALQISGGDYRPLRNKEKNSEEPFSRKMLESHLTGVATYGHYLLGTDDTCKLFVLDLDLNKEGYLPTVFYRYDPETDTANYDEWFSSFQYVPDLRAAWHDRTNLPGREYVKRQMRMLAQLLCGSVYHYAKIPTAAAYSGNKGFHVYGFTGVQDANLVREIAEIIVNSFGYWEPYKGQSFLRDSRCQFVPDWTTSPDFNPGYFANWTLEIFPKQTSLDGKDLGNLTRLPLGVNLHHPQDPTFFIDLTSSFDQLKPVDPIHALTVTDPFSTVAAVTSAPTA